LKKVDEKNEILKALREKYMFYSDIVKRNRLDIEHYKYCNQTSHRQCGANWGHADIMREIVCRIWWWFTGEKPVFVKIKNKPKLQSIMEYVIGQRKEGELDNTEYSWIIGIKGSCKQFLELNSSEKPKKSSKRPKT